MARGPKPKSLSESHPGLEDSWSKNNATPFDSPLLVQKSKEKFLWVLNCGHEVSRSITYQLSTLDGSRKCPYCSGKALLSGYNDLETLYPTLARELVNEDPRELLAKSDKAVSWKCPQGHEYTMKVWRRTGNDPRGCPVCAGKKVISGSNDLRSNYPELAKEYSETNSIPSDSITVQSKRKVTWECKVCSHSWVTTVQARTRFGNGCPVCGNRVFTPGKNDLATIHPELANKYSVNNLLPSHLVPAWGKVEKYLWKCKKGHEWEAIPDNVGRGSGCPHCVHQISSTENDLAEYIRELLPEEEILRSQRILREEGRRGVSELDIYLPSLGIAFEFNGVYYHTERFDRGKNNHKRKREMAASLGIDLRFIWSDTWELKNEACKRMVASLVGKRNLPTVYARKTTISLITSTEAAQFLEKYHIQGKATGKYYLGLKHQEELVAVLVLRKIQGKTYLLSRYATALNVPGGHSKLIKWVSRNLPIDSLETFADLDVSNGNLYETTGWTLVKELDPDYMYVVGSVREHKFNYRKQRFKTDKNLLYEEGLSESQLATMNGLYRAWDSGKKKYTLDLTKLERG